MNNFQKIFFLKKIFLLLLFFPYQLFALDEFQVKAEKPYADTLINKITVPKDSTSRVKRTAGMIPIKVPSLLNENFKTSIISKNTLETTDYRTTADFFTTIPFGFVRDLGSVGQPNETMIYGQGFGNISFLSDGLSINNRLSNALDLNLFQSESIDSIEVIPLSRGFLFGTMNNPVSINFISRQPELRKPYSRIRYYQAPNSEGMIDGIFNISPFKRLVAYFEITNQSTNPNFDNTDHSNWMGTARLQYLLSNNINIIANYKYVKTITQLSGGVDVDSIKRVYSSSQVESILYNNLSAPVRFSDRYQKVTGHNFSLRMLGNFIEHSPTDISFYYQSNLTEFRQNEYGALNEFRINKIVDDNFYKTVGLNLRQDFIGEAVNLCILSNWERTAFDSPLITDISSTNSFSTAAQLLFKTPDSFINPTLFGKYSRYSGKNLFGYGADLNMKITNKLSLYLGISRYDKPSSALQQNLLSTNDKSTLQSNTTFETKINFNYSLLNAQLGYFIIEGKKEFVNLHSYFQSSVDEIELVNLYDTQLQGININLEFRFWKIHFTTNSNFYFDKGQAPEYNYHYHKLPEYSSSGGVYYVDTLFNRNLKLKTGFNYMAIGKRDYYLTDFERLISSNQEVIIQTAQGIPIYPPTFSPSFQLDFFLAGKIQNLATVYFVFENVFNAKYFIVPYYPKQARGIRFGLSWEFLD